MPYWPPGETPAIAHRASGLGVAALHLAVVAALVWPILHVGFPLLTDYPNHLARFFIMDQLPQSSELQRLYHLRSGLFPYLSMNLVVRPLAPLIGLEPAGRVFVALAVIMPYLGTLAVARALHGRVGVWPILAALFCYNYDVAFGFVTFTFTLGLCLFALAGWIATERWPATLRLPAFAVVASGILVCHILVIGLYGLLLGAWELGKGGGRRALPGLLQVGLHVVPALLLILLIPPADLGDPRTVWGTVPDRVAALLSPVAFAKNPWEAVLLLGAGLTILLGRRAGWLRFDPRLGWMIALLGIAIFAMPHQLHGVQLMEYRLPVLFAFLVVAAYRPTAGRRIGWIYGVGVAAVLLVRLVDVDARLVAADGQVAEFRAAARIIPPGARILPAIIWTNASSYPFWASNYLHLAALLAIDRQAFYPLLFAMYEVGVNPPYAASSTSVGLPISFERLAEPETEGPGPWWTHWRGNFDYVVLFHFGEKPASLPAPLSSVADGEFFSIYRVAAP